jgi:hypothetical protein
LVKGASIEEVAERDRELAVEDVRWRMVDGDVRYMAVDGDGERPVHRRRSLMKLINHEFLLLGCWAGLVMPVVPFVPGFGPGDEGVGQYDIAGAVASSAARLVFAGSSRSG